MKWTNRLENLFRNRRHIANDEPTSENSCNNQPTPLPIDFNLRLLVIADTHGCLYEDEIPLDHNADVCLLLGDIYQQDIAIIREHINNIPIYGVLGNHDSFYLYDMCGIENIHGKVVEVNDIRIAGMQGSLRYKNSDMPLYTDEESVEIAESVEPADILISHDSPKFLHGDRDFAHSGLQGITYYCEKHNIPLNIHGHHHENMRWTLENGTTSICCYGVKIVDISPTGITVNVW